MKIGTQLVVLGLLALACRSGNAQFTALAWNAATGDEIPINIGSPTTVNVDAYPGMNYALLASKTRDLWYSDLGLVEVNLADPDFSIGIDGFDPSHHLFSWGFVNANGDFDFSFVPYPVNSPLEDPIFFQVVAQDPTKSLGYSLSNFVGAKSQPLKPVVFSVSPRSVSVGGTVTILGDYLDGTPSLGQAPTVTMGDDVLTVTNWSRNQITATVPNSAHSGSIRVHSDKGSSVDLWYNVNHYVSVIGNLATEGTPAADLIDGHVGVFGQIDLPTDQDEYLIHLEAGEELFVEIFNFDPINLTVKPYDPAAWQTVQLNSELRFRMPTVPIDPLIVDNDGGPGFAAGIGTATAERFVAPFTGDYPITVKSAFQYTTGYYLLNTWTKPAPTGGEPGLVGIHPNVIAIGGEVEVYCWGVDFGNIATITVEFQGPNTTWIPVAPYLNAAGRLAVTVPAGARTGHLRVRNAQNLVSSFDADDYPSFYLVAGNLFTESQGFSYAASAQIMGTISITQEVDDYFFSLGVGDVVRVRAFPFDFFNSRVMKGEFFDPAWLDPEIRIEGQWNGPILLASDIHSGPGIAAEIGDVVPPFVPTVASSYRISVRSWFFLTQGDYLLDVEID